ncbi:MAG: YaiI/YqxD family protein [Gammaproteobacteria bacterium]
MQIWVDADACPVVIKEILFRAANRTKTLVILVSNQPLYSPPSLYIKKIQVSAGFDVADNQIIKDIQGDDLVITADIPLADAVIEKGATALNPRGELYTKTNIKQRLSMRNFSEGLRSSGRMTGGPDKISKKEIQTFANCLDQFLNSQR